MTKRLKEIFCSCWSSEEREVFPPTEVHHLVQLQGPEHSGLLHPDDSSAWFIVYLLLLLLFGLLLLRKAFECRHSVISQIGINEVECNLI